MKARRKEELGVDEVDSNHRSMDYEPTALTAMLPCSNLRRDGAPPVSRS
jgi:hypothetical protein